MSTTRRFCCDDLLKFNNINLDVLTETASLQCSTFLWAIVCVCTAVFALRLALVCAGLALRPASLARDCWHPQASTEL